jgi:protein ImuB
VNTPAQPALPAFEETFRGRRACADLPALPLQLLLAAHPEWKTLPAAVVDADEPTGTLLWVNAAAWRSGLRPGMRYASALALNGHLRAGTVSAGEIDAAVAAITTTLRSHTPHVEPSREEAGVFWLDASGLDSLYTSTDAWAQAVVRSIRAAGFEVHLAAGFTRFGTYALARTLHSGAALRARTSAASRRVLVCHSEEEERRLVRDVALERLGIEPKLRDALLRLGVRTVGAFVDLPGDGIRRRFGAEALQLHRRARGDAWDPLQPLAAEEELRRTLLLEDPVTDTGIVLFLVRRLLVVLLEPLAAREQAVRSVSVTLHRSLRRDRPSLSLEVSTAEPTLDEAVLVDLVRLRLEAEVRRALAGSSIVEIDVKVEAAAAGREQLRLFRESRRDLAAGTRALARLRAEFGEGSVVRAVLREGHLPEAGYVWEPVDKVVLPSPRVVLLRPLVRRIEAHPLALPPKPFRERDDCWIASAASGEGRDTVRGRMQRGTAHGRVEAMAGPYIVSGGWWNREVHREYHYASTDNGEILWVYYDRQRRRWFLAGKVE